MEWNRLENEQFSPLEAFTADEEGKPPIQARHFPMTSICYVSVFGIEHQSLLLSHLFYPCVPCRRTMYCLRIMNDVFRVPYTFVYDSVWNGDTTHIARICRQIAFQLLCLSNVCFDVRLRTRRRVSFASISHLSMGWVAIQCLFATILWHLISVAKSFSLSPSRAIGGCNKVYGALNAIHSHIDETHNRLLPTQCYTSTAQLNT